MEKSNPCDDMISFSHSIKQLYLCLLPFFVENILTSVVFRSVFFRYQKTNAALKTVGQKTATTFSTFGQYTSQKLGAMRSVMLGYVIVFIP